MVLTPQVEILRLIPRARVAKGRHRSDLYIVAYAVDLFIGLFARCASKREDAALQEGSSMVGSLGADST